MKNSCMCSFEGRETFTEHQIEEISAVITNAVEEIIIRQCTDIEKGKAEFEVMRNTEGNAQ